MNDGGSVFLAKDASLRDWFAAMALNGVFAASFIAPNSWVKEMDERKMDGEELMAEMAYMMADAMLKEREKNP